MKPECGPGNNRTKVLAILWYWPGAERVFPLVIIASQPLGVRYDRKNVAGGYAPDKRRPTRFAPSTCLTLRLARCRRFSICLRPSGEWHKGHGHQFAHLEVTWPLGTLGHQHEHLGLERIAYRDHHSPACLQLLHQ